MSKTDKVIREIIKEYGPGEFNPDRLELLMENYYKECEVDLDMTEKISIWEKVFKNLSN